MTADALQADRPPQRLRRNVQFHAPDAVLHRLIALLPLGYGGWCLLDGRTPPPMFWWLVVATVMFHLLVRTTPYVRLTPSGIRFPQHESGELKWTDLREARNTADSLKLLLGDGQQVQIDYHKMRTRDVQRLKQIVRSQCLALAAEAQATG